MFTLCNSFLLRQPHKVLLYKNAFYTTFCEQSSRFKVIPSKLSMKEKILAYADLSKTRLSSLVVLTTLAGYALPSFETFDVKIMAVTCLGTALCSFSANTMNQLIEVPFDAQMARTRNRVLPRHSLSSLHALSFGLATGVAGSALLFSIHPYVGLIGAGNILLYSFIYTPLKRISFWNTWIGAIVGALPPLIGSCAANPLCFSSPSTWILPMLLFAWQFPHFNSLSWNLRKDYSKAGYRMLSVLDPAKNTLVSLKYSLAMFGVAAYAYFIDFATPMFLLNSSLLNGALCFYAYKFHQERTEKSARKLFFFTLIYLPAIMALLIFHKKREGQSCVSFAKIHSKLQASNPCMNPLE